jgi:hypothetical protein
MGLYLSILARLMLRSQKPESTKLLVSLYLSNDQFCEVFKLYVINLFGDLSTDKRVTVKRNIGKTNS